jgi:hypothetical protein
MKTVSPSSSFEEQDLAAHGGLRDVQLFAGARKGAGLGDRAQDFELSEIHLLVARGAHPPLAAPATARYARLRAVFCYGQRYQVSADQNRM